MKERNWKTYAIWILTAEAVGGLAGWLTREGTKLYNATITKPLLSPPSIVFPVAWTILYALMGIGAARIYSSAPSKARTCSLAVFSIQLVYNFLWSFIFFNKQAFGAALLWLIVLWGLILWMTVCFNKIDKPAARLQIPYLIWVAFAAYLNFGVWRLN